MAKTIVNFSDYHAHLFMDFSQPDPRYTTDRFFEQIQVLESVLAYAKVNDADVLFNGDLFHKRTVLDVRVFNEVFEVFTQYPEVQVYLLRGNHDSVTNSLYTESVLTPFKALSNIRVIDELEHIDTPDYSLYCVPYGEEVEVMKEWIADKADGLDQNKFNILCAHIGVDGSSTGKYSHTLSGAFKVGDLFPDKFDVVTLGHYHKRQHLGDLPNVFYVGNTLQTSFSDEGQDKGFMVIEINEDKKWQSSFVKTEYRPFVTMTGETAENVPEDLSGAFYQFIGTPDEARAVKEIKEEQQLSNVRISVQKDYSVKPRIDITAGSTPEEVVRAYVTKNNPALEEKALACLRDAMEV